jgi:hypothetical protein
MKKKLKVKKAFPILIALGVVAEGFPLLKIIADSESRVDY